MRETDAKQSRKNKRTRQESPIERLGELGPPESPAAGHCVDGRNQREGFGLELGFLLTGTGPRLMRKHLLSQLDVRNDTVVGLFLGNDVRFSRENARN